VIPSSHLDGPTRDGRIIECRNANGTPPYVVEWSDTGDTGFVFPGPDAKVQHLHTESHISVDHDGSNSARRTAGMT
jgi:hypothetical protein